MLIHTFSQKSSCSDPSPWWLVAVSPQVRVAWAATTANTLLTGWVTTERACSALSTWRVSTWPATPHRTGGGHAGPRWPSGPPWSTCPRGRWSGLWWPPSSAWASSSRCWSSCSLLPAWTAPAGTGEAFTTRNPNQRAHARTHTHTHFNKHGQKQKMCFLFKFIFGSVFKNHVIMKCVSLPNILLHVFTGSRSLWLPFTLWEVFVHFV